MTTYTSLLSGDPYIAEDWTVTIREKHADDLPGLYELRGMIRQLLDMNDPYYRAQVVSSYNHLVNSFSRSHYSFNRADQELVRKVLSVFRQELGV